jgi:hypothetical protein
MLPVEPFKDAVVRNERSNQHRQGRKENSDWKQSDDHPCSPNVSDEPCRGKGQPSGRALCGIGSGDWIGILLHQLLHEVFSRHFSGSPTKRQDFFTPSIWNVIPFGWW